MFITKTCFSRNFLGSDLRLQVDGLFSLKNNYVHTNASNKDGLPRQSFSTANLNVAEKLEEAAKTAAYKVFEAETLSYVAADSVAEAEKIMKLAEETDSIMQLAKGILDGCKFLYTILLN